MRPIQRFLQLESASALVLIAATVVAVSWVNSPWGASYDALWRLELGPRLQSWDFSRPLYFWVNDGLMTLFFVVVGLEIRREIHAGELSEPRKAALPVAAAAGGVVLPALIYAAFNAGSAGAAGWAIPMATDIAFAVGVLTLLGSRAPPALRALLLGLAVIDDLAAILVIAVFYSEGVENAWLGVGAAGVAAAIAFRHFGFLSPVAYLIPGFVIWGGLYAGGVHPTLAGVVLGLLMPIKAGQRLQDCLHAWVALAIVPLFALANAGIRLGSLDLNGDALLVFVGVIVGLAVGKPLGIVLACRLSTAAGLAIKPRDAGTAAITVVGLAGGVGFTMSLFIANLAFAAGPILDAAKLGILVGSGVAAVAALGFGAAVLRPATTVAGESRAKADTSGAE